MAIENKLIVVLDLETGDVSKAFKPIEKKAGNAGKKSGKNFANNFGSSIAGINKQLLKYGSLITGLATGLVFKKSIDAAIAQEDAVNRLNSALQISGKFSEQASQDLQDYASSLQLVTKFGDEAILETQALIQSLGNLSQGELKDATKTTLDLASALKIDLASAATLVGKAAAGEVGSFGRYGVAIKKGADNTETFANALTALNSKFGGAASKEINTFSGAFTQLSNSFGDALEKIGDLIIKNPIVIAGIKALNQQFVSLGSSIGEFGKSFKLDGVIASIKSFSDAIINFILAPFELVINIAKLVQATINQVFSALVVSIGKVGGVIGGLLEKVGVLSEVSASLKDFSESSSEVFNETGLALENAFNGLGDFSLTDSFAQKNEELIAGLQGLQTTIEENKPSLEINGLGKQGDDESGEVFDPFADLSKTAGLFFAGLNKGYETSAKAGATFKNGVAALGATIKNSLGKGVGQAFQNVGKALKDGTNAFDAFAAGFKAILGNILSATGDFFIAQGLGYLFLPGQQALGAGLIAAGAGAKLLAGLLGGSSGGGASASTAPTGSAIDPINTSSEFSDAELTDPDTLESQEPRTEVNLVVQGNVLDSQESGTAILKTLNEAFEKQGGYFTDSRSVG